MSRSHEGLDHMNVKVTWMSRSYECQGHMNVNVKYASSTTITRYPVSL